MAEAGAGGAEPPATFENSFRKEWVNKAIKDEVTPGTHTPQWLSVAPKQGDFTEQHVDILLRHLKSGATLPVEVDGAVPEVDAALSPANRVVLFEVDLEEMAAPIVEDGASAAWKANSVKTDRSLLSLLAKAAKRRARDGALGGVSHEIIKGIRTRGDEDDENSFDFLQDLGAAIGSAAAAGSGAAEGGPAPRLVVVLENWNKKMTGEALKQFIDSARAASRNAHRKYSLVLLSDRLLSTVLHATRRLKRRYESYEEYLIDRADKPHVKVMEVNFAEAHDPNPELPQRMPEEGEPLFVDLFNQVKVAESERGRTFMTREREQFVRLLWTELWGRYRTRSANTRLVSLLLGPPGIGKSELFIRFLRCVPRVLPSVVTVYLPIEEKHAYPWSIDDVLRDAFSRACAKWGHSIDLAEEESFRNALMLQTNVTVVLVIDEAESIFSSEHFSSAEHARHWLADLKRLTSTQSSVQGRPMRVSVVPWICGSAARLPLLFREPDIGGNARLPEWLQNKYPFADECSGQRIPNTRCKLFLTTGRVNGEAEFDEIVLPIALDHGGWLEPREPRVDDVALTEAMEDDVDEEEMLNEALGKEAEGEDGGVGTGADAGGVEGGWDAVAGAGGGDAATHETSKPRTPEPVTGKWQGWLNTHDLHLPSGQLWTPDMRRAMFIRSLSRPRLVDDILDIAKERIAPEESNNHWDLREEEMRELMCCIVQCCASRGGGERLRLAAVVDDPFSYDLQKARVRMTQLLETNTTRVRRGTALVHFGHIERNVMHLGGDEQTRDRPPDAVLRIPSATLKFADITDLANKGRLWMNSAADELAIANPLDVIWASLTVRAMSADTCMSAFEMRALHATSLNWGEVMENVAMRSVSESDAFRAEFLWGETDVVVPRQPDPLAAASMGARDEGEKGTFFGYRVDVLKKSLGRGATERRRYGRRSKAEREKKLLLHLVEQLEAKVLMKEFPDIYGSDYIFLRLVGDRVEVVRFQWKLGMSKIKAAEMRQITLSLVNGTRVICWDIQQDFAKYLKRRVRQNQISVRNVLMTTRPFQDDEEAREIAREAQVDVVDRHDLYFLWGTGLFDVLCEEARAQYLPQEVQAVMREMGTRTEWKWTGRYHDGAGEVTHAVTPRSILDSLVGVGGEADEDGDGM